MAIILIYNGRYVAETAPQPSKAVGGKKVRPRQLILFGSISAVALMTALSIFFSRSLAFDRLLGGNGFDELRTHLLPTLFAMAGDYFPWGSGLGSFEYAYRIYEPQELLNPSYLNHAHNDWLQFLIEGGAFAALIGATALIWFLSKLIKTLRNWRVSRYTKYAALMSGFVMVCFLTGSIGDYPLRTPFIIAVFGVMSCFFGDTVLSVQRKDTKQIR